MFDPSDCQQLQVSLHFFDETVVAVKHDHETGRRTAHPVALSDVAQALAGVTLGSEVLPPDVLFWQRRGGEERIGLYAAPRVWRVSVRPAARVDAAVVWQVPMPPLLWVGCGPSYSIWALKGRPGPNDAGGRLWRAPLPNVYPDGRVCAGTVRFPACSARTIRPALALFFASEFNAHIGAGRSRSRPEALLELWRELAGRRRYPLGDLVRDERTLADVIAAGGGR